MRSPVRTRVPGASVTDSERRAKAREQTLGWLNDAVRRDDYLEAVQWLDTLAAVDERFTLTRGAYDFAATAR